MIIFKKLTYRNFLGAGNAPVSIQLNKSRTTLIIGENGAGKSSGVLDGITFALYGKPFRNITKDQLINSINGKQCETEIEFSIGTKEYRVRRGMKPNVFEIFCDGKMIDQPGNVRDYQEILEKQILQMNSKTFTQVVLLSVANFEPFMKLDTKTRRNIIEDILDIKVFSDMNTVLKEKLSSLKENSRVLEDSIDVQNQKIDVIKQYIEKLSGDKKAKEEELTTSIQLSADKIAALESEVNALQVTIDTLYDKIEDEPKIVAKKNKLQPIALPLRGRVEKLKEKVEFYSTATTCPTCSQNIDDSIKEVQLKKNKEKIEEIDAAIVQLNQQLDLIEKRNTEIVAIKREILSKQEQLQQLNSSIIAEQTYLRRLNSELNALAKDVGDITVEQKKMDEYSEAAKTFARQKAELSESKQYYDIAATLLKDSGIKTKIIDQYIPVINKLINQYLCAMDTWINFHLDSEFNETIKSRYRDTFTYASFSEGEKQRIDLAILFTWRTIAKMKNSVSTNLLVMDEILDTCLDSAGTEYVVQLLDTLGEGTNVFVISHKVADLQDKFHSILKFEKINNFSCISQS